MFEFRAICKCTILIGIVFVVSNTGFAIVNYDNHPDLEKAMIYDLSIRPDYFRKPNGQRDEERYDQAVEDANGIEAVKHYLAYIEDVDESFQRVRIYARLIDIYTGGVSHKVTSSDKIDRPTAIMYARKILAEEPTRIGSATIDARAVLTSKRKAPKESYYALMDYRDWLLSIDAEQVRDNFLPSRPGSHKLAGDYVENMMSNLQQRAYTAELNLAREAYTLARTSGPRSRPVDAKHLFELIDKYPGTTAAFQAHRYLIDLKPSLTERALKKLDKYKVDEEPRRPVSPKMKSSLGYRKK